MQRIFLGVDGSSKEIHSDGELGLKEMYEIIGCDMVEHVYLADKVDMWCDEEALLKANWKINTAATAYYRKAYPHLDPQELVIVGNAIIEDGSKAGWLKSK